MINFKKHIFLLVVSLRELFLCPDWSRDSDSQVKSGCSHLYSGRFDTLLGFLGVRGPCSPGKKNRNLRSSKLPEKH